MFAQWTVSRRVSGLVAIGFPPLLFMAVLSYTNTNNLATMSAWVAHTHEVLDTNSRVASLIKDAEAGQRGYLITGEQRYLASYNDARSAVTASVGRLRDLTKDNAAQRQWIADLEPLIERKLQELQESIDVRSQKGFEEARNLVLTDRGKQATDELRSKLEEIERDERSLLKSRTASASERASATMAILVFGTLGYLLLSGPLALFVVRGLNRTLRNSVSEISVSVQQVASAASQIAAGSQGLARGSSQQAASLEETSASAEEVNSMARSNNEKSAAAAELMDRSQQMFVEANDSLEHMLTAMNDIAAQSNKISHIIKMIDEIAFQTNILSLNAAVEAARAGEAGMGFAVVADEVRNLAQRCAQAARDTSVLIEEAIVKSNDGKARVDNVATLIRNVTDQAGKAKILIDEVSEGSRQQAQGMEQIGRNVTQIERLTQDSAASAEESASAGEELTAQSVALHDAVSRIGALVGNH